MLKLTDKIFIQVNLKLKKRYMNHQFRDLVFTLSSMIKVVWEVGIQEILRSTAYQDLEFKIISYKDYLENRRI